MNKKELIIHVKDMYQESFYKEIDSYIEKISVTCENRKMPIKRKIIEK